MAEIDRWALERACWARGIALVCGCDEAGAGPLAGAEKDFCTQFQG